MPRMSGIDVVQAMARLGLTPKIIALTSEVDGKLALEPNISAFCSKPIRRGQLIHIMLSVLSSSSSPDAILVSQKRPNQQSESSGLGNGVCVLCC